jgi:hypothetical protein
MAGTKRVLLGALLFVSGVVLVVAGAVAMNLAVVAVGGLLVLGGVGVIIWGAVAGLVAWWRTWRRGELDQTRTPPPPPSFPHPHGSPSPSTSPSGSPLFAEGTPTLLSSPRSEAPETGARPEPYVVDYVERGSNRRATFSTLDSASEFYQVNSSAFGLFRVTPQGDIPVVVPTQTPASPPQSTPVVSIRPQVARVPEFLRVAEFIDDFRPSRRFDRELLFQIELAEALRGQFGREAVKTELPIPGGGRVDIEVCNVGIELKLAASVQALQTLPGQLEVYRTHYGPNLIAMVFDDTGDSRALARTRDAVQAMGIRITVAVRR